MSSIKSVFEEHNINYDEFTKATGISLSRLYNYFKRDPLDSKAFKPHEVAMLCGLLPITPDFFGRDNSIYKFKKQQSFNSLTSYGYLKESENSISYLNFLDRYYDNIISEIKKAKKSIVILDYVGDNLFVSKKLQGDFKNFHTKYESFLDSISNFIYKKKSEFEKEGKQPEPVFHRILQNPINKNSLNIEFEDDIDTVLDLSYNDMFKQFDKLYAKDCRDYFKLSWAKNAIRPYSLMIIDEKIIITEYVVYNKDLEPIPDILFIDHKTDDTSADIANVLIKSHMKYINPVIHSKETNILRNFAKLRLKEIEKKYQLEIDKLKEDIKGNKTRFNSCSELSEECKYLNEKIPEQEERLSFLENRLILTNNKLKNFNELQ